MPSSLTGNSTAGSAQILTARDVLIGPGGVTFDPSSALSLSVIFQTQVPTISFRTILFQIYHFPFYNAGNAAGAPVLPDLAARLGCSWRPVGLSAPGTRQDFVPPGAVVPYEPAISWTPLAPPQLCPPGIPVSLSINSGGMMLVAIELSVPAAALTLDRFRVFVNAGS